MNEEEKKNNKKTWRQRFLYTNKQIPYIYVELICTFVM